VLGLSAPRKVVSVKLEVPAGQVRIQLEHAAGVRWKFPECDRELAANSVEALDRDIGT
jgi:hypothetical protein